MKNIYYDETLHTRKIGYKGQKLRFNEENEYFFMYSFIEIDDCTLIEIAELERKFKKSRNINEANELKSSNLNEKNIVFMKDDQKEFYFKLFKLLKNENKIFNISFLMKLQPFFEFFMFPKYIYGTPWVKPHYRYSFQKYLSVRRMTDLQKLISHQMKAKDIYRVIKKWLEQDALLTEREEEKAVFRNLSMALEYVIAKDRRIWKEENLFWSYKEIPTSFSKIMDERNEDGTTLYYDTFPRLENIWDELSKIFQEDHNFKAIPVHSKNNLGTRVVDWYLGFMRRVILDLSFELNKVSQKFNTSQGVNKEVIDYMNDNSDVFISFREIISNDYWSTLTTGYSDHFLLAILALNILARDGFISEKELYTQYEQKINAKIIDLKTK